MKETKRKFSLENLQAVAKVLKIIGHPTRLEILEILEEEEPLDVGTICSRLGSPCETSMMSHHLAKMKDNGILTSEKAGKQVYYKIADRHILNIFDCMGNCTFI